MVFNFVHFNRIADAIIPLGNEVNSYKYLKPLLSDTVDLFKRKESYAKNILWEIELWSKLKRQMHDVYLQEPDLMLDFSGSTVSMACKKIYSEKNVEKTLSDAVRQTKFSGALGIISMNLDDLTPAETILRSNNFETMNNRLVHLNGEFIRNHERYFQKYLSKGRIIAVLVSTTVIAAIDEATPPIYTASQWNIWTMPGISEEYDSLAKRVYHLVMQ